MTAVMYDRIYFADGLEDGFCAHDRETICQTSSRRASPLGRRGRGGRMPLTTS